MKKEAERRSVFERYIGEIANACEAVTGTDAAKIFDALKKQAEKKTAQADNKLDEDGQIINHTSRLDADEQVIIIKEAIPDLDDDDSSEDLFGDSKATLKPRTGKKKTGKKTTRKKSTRKRS